MDAERFEALLRCADGKVFENGFEYYELFRKLGRKNGGELDGEQRKALAWEEYLFGSQVTSRVDGSDKQRFIPVFGNTFFHPNDMGRDALEYFWSRACNTPNPVLKAWYLDVVFESIVNKKYRGNGAPEKHDVARRLVEAFLEAYKIYPEDAKPARIDSLYGAREVAVASDDPMLLERTFDVVDKYIDLCRGEKDYRWMLDGIDILLRKRKNIDEKKFEKYLNYAEEAIFYYVEHPPENPTLLLAFYALKYKLVEIVDGSLYTREDLAEDHARFYIKAADNSIGSPVKRQYYYREAHEAYVKANMRDKAEKVARRIAEIGRSDEYAKEFDRYVRNFELTADQKDKIRKDLGTGRDFPRKMVAHFLPKWSAGEEQSHGEILRRSFFALFPEQIVGERNHPEGACRDGNAQVHARAIFYRMSALSYSSLKNFLREKIDNGEVYLEDFDFFFRGIEVIDEPTYRTVRKGLELFFKEEFLAATYILTVQLEVYLRMLPEPAGSGPIKHQEGRASASEGKTLGGVIDELEAVLPSDVYHSLKCVLVDDTGYNLREEVARGSVKIDSDNELYGTVLILLFCALLLTELKPENPKRSN